MKRSIVKKNQGPPLTFSEPTLPWYIANNRNDTDIDWNEPNNARQNFPQRLATAFFANEWCSDISVYIPKDDRTVPAHRLILGAASPVLQRCCFGTGSLKGDQQITVPDYCSTEELMIVLHYLYVGGAVDGLVEANVAQVLKMADYFELSQLQKQCEAFMRSSMSPDNVCSYFNQIHNLDSVLVETCMEFMLICTKDLLENGSAMLMEDAALFKLLAPENCLDISSELELVSPMVEWADAQCHATYLEVTPNNRRLVMADRVKLLLFTAMNHGDFMESLDILGEGFLTNDEIAPTVREIHARSKPDPKKVVCCHESAVPSVVERRCERILSDASFTSECSFTIDVNHMKKPFKLTSIVLYDQQLSYNLEIINEGRPVPFEISGQYILFSNGGLSPDWNQQIVLKFEFGCEQDEYQVFRNHCPIHRSATIGPTFKVKDVHLTLRSSYPKLLNPYGIVSSYYYSCPK